MHHRDHSVGRRKRDDDAYRGVVWEIRGYEISRNYDSGARPLANLGYYPAERFS